jgi:hypothetical protein
MNTDSAREAVAHPVSAAVGALSAIVGVASGLLDPIIHVATLVGPTLMTVVGVGARVNSVATIVPPWLVQAGIIIAAPLFGLALAARLWGRLDRLVGGDD